jgi:hypothetical protein
MVYDLEILTPSLDEELCRDCRRGQGTAEKKRGRLPDMPRPGWISPRKARRGTNIMSTTILCKYMKNKALTKMGNFYLLGKNYQPENLLSIPFYFKKTGLFPIRGLKDGAIPHLASSHKRPRIAILGDFCHE